MILSYALNAAEEFGRRLAENRESLCIEDLMLFGSVVRGKEEPKDLDLMLIHDSQILDDFQASYQDREVRDTEKLIALAQMLAGKADLPKILIGTKAMSLIEQGLFNLGYMGRRFFTNTSYRNAWQERNRGTHGKEGDGFAEEIFAEGKLFDWQTGRYEIPASNKYKVGAVLL